MLEAWKIPTIFAYINLWNEMTEKEKYEDAIRRFEIARNRKRAVVARLEAELKEEYERRTGKKCNYVLSL